MDKEREENGSQPPTGIVVAFRLIGVLETAIKSGTGVTLGYFGLEAIRSLAGKTTHAEMIVDILGQHDITDALRTLAIIAAVAWALIERRERRRKTRYLAARIKRLETQLDPGRSSSGINSDGTTNPMDKL